MTFTTGDNNFGTAKFIVDAIPGKGTHTTIAAALAASISGNTIFIRPGTYTENLTLVSGVNLTGFSGNGFQENVVIIGKCSYSGSGVVTLSGLMLQTNSDNFLSVSGTGTVNILNCFLNCSNATGITVTNSSAIIFITYCAGDIGTTGISLFNITNCATFSVEYTEFTNTGASSTASSIAAGTTQFRFATIPFPLSSTSTGQINLRFVVMFNGGINATCVTMTGSGTPTFQHVKLISGTASAISIGSGIVLELTNSSIASTNTNAITGSGTLQYSNVAYTSSSTINVTTQTPFATGPIILLAGGPQITSGSGSPNGLIAASKGSLYLRTDGSSSATRAYINTNGTTAWTNITTAA